MNNPISDNVVASVIGLVISSIVGAVFGQPIAKAWRNRRTTQEIAAARQAEADGALAHLDVADARASEDLLKRWADRLDKVETARAEALELLQKARDDVHEVRNTAMIQIHAATKAAETEMKRVQHGAESRIAAAEARVETAERRIEELMDQVRERDATIKQLMEENQRFSALLTRRMDKAGFDPSRTDTE